jgi:hypothetical protein
VIINYQSLNPRLRMLSRASSQIYLDGSITWISNLLNAGLLPLMHRLSSMPAFFAASLRSFLV